MKPVKSTIATFREFTGSEAAGGLFLLVATGVALTVANSGLAPGYFGWLESHWGPMTTLRWINDGLMTLFFLLVGLEIKRELVCGELASARQRMLPFVGAVGGMAMPALIYLIFTWNEPALARGWAIPAATDIAFALAVLTMLGRRVPRSLRAYLAALAIFDDLAAIVIIAIFYSQQLLWPLIGLAGAISLALLALNRQKVSHLGPYLLLGLLLWLCILGSGVHATVSGVILAFSIPLDPKRPDEPSPLHRLEHRLDGLVPYLVVPLFGFANAGISITGLYPAILEDHTAGIVLGLLVGKVVGVFGLTWAVVSLGRAALPSDASWPQFLGVAFLCGIGFTMSIFISLLAFAGQPEHIEGAKLGVLIGSLLSGLVGVGILWRSDSQSSPCRAAE